MKNLLILFSILCLFSSSAFCMEYEDLNSVKQPFYRLGITDDPEEMPTVKTQDKNTRDLNGSDSIDKLTYADLSIKRISKTVSKELEIDQDVMQRHLSLLWQGAATKSDIIKFTLYKLSNPDQDKPDEKSVKKVLQSIANMSTLVGAGVGNPLISSTSFLSGSVLGIFSQDDKTVNYKYTKVNDADMIVVVRKIEDLQQKVVNRYYDYITARKVYEISSETAKKRYANFQNAQNSTKEVIIITDAYYREALDEQMKAQLDFMSKRASLEELVGNETFTEFEKLVNAQQN